MHSNGFDSNDSGSSTYFFFSIPTFLELIFVISSSVDQATISILTAISSRTSKATMALPRDVSSSFSGGRVGLSDSKALRSRKRALRKDVDSNLKELTKVNQRVSATH